QHRRTASPADPAGLRAAAALHPARGARHRGPGLPGGGTTAHRRHPAANGGPGDHRAGERATAAIAYARVAQCCWQRGRSGQAMSRMPAAVLSVALLGTAGCAGLANVPLPGGADTGTNPYRVTAEFSDVLELVPQSLVKVNDVSVGAVREIRLAPQSW